MTTDPSTPANPDYRTVIERIVALPGFIHEMGVELDHLAPGAADMVLAPRPGLLQFTGAVHGGAVGALADHAAGCAATSLMPAGQVAITAEYKINFLELAKGDAVVARARVERAGRRVTVVRVDVFARTGDDERKCAIATVTLTPTALG
jgi:uncharacterized protein (TIGR00369 family)